MIFASSVLLRVRCPVVTGTSTALAKSLRCGMLAAIGPDTPIIQRKCRRVIMSPAVERVIYFAIVVAAVLSGVQNYDASFVRHFLPLTRSAL